MHTEAGWPFCIEIAGLLLWTKACINPALVAVVQPVGICNIETWRAFLRILTLMGCKIAFIRYNVVLGSFSLDERQGGLASPLR
jgi:hypothetical protein